MRRFFTASPLIAAALASISFAPTACTSRDPDPPAPSIGHVAQAETDTFLNGSGRDGAITSSGLSTINDYGAITAAVAIGGLTIAIDDTTPFKVGQIVMIWQVVGLTAVDAPSGSAALIDLGAKPVGQYELGRIFSINAAGKTITLTNPVINAYAAVGAQVIRVPEYTNVTISSGGSISPAQPWDGKKGGVVAFLATGVVQNDGSINADGAGLRGGVVENNPLTLGCTALDGFSVVGAVATGGDHKGEGLVPTAFATTTTKLPNSIYGRGNVSIGGGGGDCENSGGGGGGHAGAGGLGGNTWVGDVGRVVGGLGGATVKYTAASKLSLGGGGGAGEENDNVGGGGGAGGGVVWIRGGSLTGTGTITATGGNGINASNDGGGGGGAGGIAYVQLATSADCASVSASGGKGGNCAATHGPGGGGGGGFVFVNSSGGTCSGGKLVATGGSSGTDTVSARGSAAGSAGTTTGGAAATGGKCDPRTGLCGGCIDDTWCPGQHCQLATHACVTCTLDSQCAASQWCKTDTGTCTTKLDNGVALPTVSFHSPTLDGTCSSGVATAICVSATCDTDGKCGIKTGDACTLSSTCRSTVCSSTHICITAGTCAGDGDCSGGQWCSISTATCTSKLANGAGMPSDPGHTVPTLNAKCNVGAASLVCTSGACDVADDKCGLLNGDGSCAASTSDPKCRSLVCGSDAKCGLPIGEGSCSAGTAATVCRSGACGASGVCIKAGTCATDADCTIGNWCNESTATCTPTLANGIAVPNDPPHSAPTLSGKCTGAAGALVCTSTVCDPVDDKCGLLTGDKSCARDTQCRSGHCKVASSTCVQCAGDSDCTAAQYCDGTGTCAPRKADGMPCGAPDECITARCSGGTCGGIVISDAGDADVAEISVDTGPEVSDATDASDVTEAASDVATEAAVDSPTDSGGGDDGGSDAPADVESDSGSPDTSGPSPDASSSGVSVEGGGIACAVGSIGRDGEAIGAGGIFALLGLAAMRRRRSG